MPSIFGTSGFRFSFPGTLDLDTLVHLASSLYLSFPDVGGVVIGRDNRRTSDPLFAVLSSLLSSVGFRVYDAGVVPLPVLAFSSMSGEHGLGVMITASHNPPNYNGIKVFKGGWELTREEENRVTELMGRPTSLGQPRVSERVDALGDYLEKLSSQLGKHQAKKVLVDAGNGTAVAVTPDLVRRAGGNVLCVNCVGSGFFPGRLPEPNPLNLRDTLSLAREGRVDLGIAHDCDADRVAVFNGRGEFLSQTRILAYFFAKKLKSKRSGKMITTVDVGMAVDDIAMRYGGEVIRTRLGGSHELAMKDSGVVLFGEPWKVMDPDWGPWADGIRVAVKLSEDVMDEGDVDTVLREVPDYPSLREDFAFKKWDQGLLESRALSVFEGAELENYDGVKLKFDDGWVLFRRSGTEEKIRLYAEHRSADGLRELRKKAISLLTDLGFVAT